MVPIYTPPPTAPRSAMVCCRGAESPEGEGLLSAVATHLWTDAVQRAGLSQYRSQVPSPMEGGATRLAWTPTSGGRRA